MIRHIVLLNFRKDVPATTRAGLMEDLAGLRDLDGVVDFHAGSNTSVETDLIRGNEDGFWFDFTDTAARDAYLEHPRHQAVGAKLVAHTQGGIEGVSVFDMELPD